MASETCDTCGPAVTAKVIVALPSGNILTYCFHCADVNRAALFELGAGVYPLGSE